MSSVSEILETHASRRSKIVVRSYIEVDEDDDQLAPQQYLLIEGDRESLKFLADLILAKLAPDQPCNLRLHPNGGGSAHFDPSSNVGIYVHRLPCDAHPGNCII